MSQETPQLMGSGQLSKAEQEKLDRSVPEMLQQIDPKVLVQFLKASEGNANINIVTVGKYYAGSEVSSEQEDNGLAAENDRLLKEVERLQVQIRTAKSFELIDWLEGLPQPRHEYFIREMVLALKDKFETQKECSDFIGVTPRVFSYWMKNFAIPGYKPNPRKGKRGEEKC